MYFIFYFSAKILEMAVRRVLVLYENETVCGVYLLYPQFDENFVGLKYSSAKDKVNVKIRFIDLMNIGKKSGFGETLDDVLTDSIWCRTVSIKE